MKVYKAGEGDLYPIARLWKKLSDYHQSFRDYLDPSSHWVDYIIKYYSSDLHREDRMMLVAKDKHHYIGFIRGEVRSTPELFDIVTTGYISDLFVEENYRGTQASQSLVSELLKWFNQMNIKQIRLNVNSENLIAQRFYKKFGFEEVNKTLKLDIKG